MDDNLKNQLNMCYQAISRPARLYDAVVFSRDILGVTQEEFARTIKRRPEYYQPVAYLAECDEFWAQAQANSLQADQADQANSNPKTEELSDEHI